jgi:amino acid adenylation domain-containing protein
LLAAFKTLLHRYAGQNDIVVGSVISNRTHAEIQELIGLFVNTLVLRTDLSGNPTFRDLLDRVRQVALEAYSHQDLPFEKLVGQLKPERDLSRTPLFQVAFSLRGDPARFFKLPGHDISILETHTKTAKHDLFLEVVEANQGLRATMEYCTDLFDAATIARMVEHYQVLLENIVADPDRGISDLALLTEAERNQLLVEWNDTYLDHPTDICVHQLFEAQVDDAPDAIAVIFISEDNEAVNLTYGELNRRANQLAHRLIKLGIGPESPVGLFMQRSLDMVVGILGILKAGGVYVPLDPTYPRERLIFMLNDAQVPLLLTQEQLMAHLPKHDATVISLDTGWERVAEESKENPANRVTVENLAYVIYTSGSTGRPKGVLVTHRGLCNVAQEQVRSFGVGPGSRVLQFSSLNYDASVFEMVMAFGSGATLCFGGLESMLPGPGLVQFLRNLDVSVVTLPPSSMANLPFTELGSLQTVTVAGEACSPELVARWAEGRRFFNLYGPTEATIWTTMAECRNGNKKPPIGRPIANTQVYLLDSNMQLVPTGLPGEMYIGGIGLARGYLGRPSLTARTFLPNPFSDTFGERLYKTGDLARYLPDGTIEFLDRLDHQVKVRGFRIELGEIEMVLTQHRAVREAVVLAREDVPGEKRLVAYVVPNQGQEPTTKELRDFLRQKLPHYMIPSAFMMLEILPLLPNGKVDRRALPAPEGIRPDSRMDYEEPQTEMERTIASVWRKVLDIDEIGLNDKFFDLGGHSLLMLKAHTELDQIITDKDLTIVNMFEHPTVKSLAQYLSQTQGETSLQSVQERAREQKRSLRRKKQFLRERIRR